MVASVYNETSPAGFDLQVSYIQNSLAKLTFIEAIFGVARLQCELRQDEITQDTYLIPDMGKKGTLKHERYYPQGRKLNSSVDLTIDDTYTSRIFFLAKDPISLNPNEDRYDWADQNPEIKQPFSILCHFNLQKIFNLNLGISNYEQLKLAVIYALNQVPKIILNSAEENIDNFWKEFSMTPEINGFGMYPFCCLRIDADAYYFAYPNNGEIQFDPSTLYNSNTSITPNSNNGYATVN